MTATPWKRLLILTSVYTILVSLLAYLMSQNGFVGGPGKTGGGLLFFIIVGLGILLILLGSVGLNMLRRKKGEYYLTLVHFVALVLWLFVFFTN